MNKKPVLIIFVVALIILSLIVIHFQYQQHQVNKLDVKIENKTNVSVNLSIQILDSRNNSIYQNKVTLESGKSFRTGEIIKKKDKYQFILQTNTGLYLDEKRWIDEGFHSPMFEITNDEIKIVQIVE